jgi:hypothetical protein
MCEWIAEANLELHSIYNSDFGQLDMTGSTLEYEALLTPDVESKNTRISPSANLLKEIAKRLRFVWLVNSLHLRPMLFVVAQKPFHE